MSLLRQTINETPGAGRLGRHVVHDARSRHYPAAQAATITSVRWTRRSPILDQGSVGGCVGFACAGWLATDNASRLGRADITDDLALSVYSKATHLDRIRGVWKPTDTGTAGLYGAKAMRALGLTSAGFSHAFGLDHALGALQLGPVMVGMTWLTGCDNPDRKGRVTYAGTVRGGHEVLADELDTDLGLIWFQNSWSSSFGKAGRFAMSVEDFGRALADHGDVTVPS